MNTPKLSIITVNLNNAEGLRKTIESVVSQTFSDYEYIIIDGGSTDGSVEIIKEYADKITYWVSEPDKGIYNGMNKGIKVAKGEYCQFLNSGDYLVFENTLSEVFTNFPEKDIVYGNILINNTVKTYPKYLDFAHFLKDSIPHPASFIKKSLFEKYGNYNESLCIVSDWEFFIDVIIINKCTYEHCGLTVSNFDLSGMSSLKENREKLKAERHSVIKKHIDLIINEYFTLERKLNKYKNSRIIQLVKKMQDKFYN